MNAISTHKVFVWVDRLGSTQDFLAAASKIIKKNDTVLIVSADNQYDGRGQHHKSWLKTPGKGLSFSIAINRLRWPVAHIFNIHLAVTLGIDEALQSLHPGLSLQFKWPNDLVLKDRKIGGILIQNTLTQGLITSSIIGIGLNTHPVSHPELHHPSSSLSEHSSHLHEHQTYVKKITEHILQKCEKIPLSSSNHWLQSYNQKLWKKKQNISLQFQNNTREARLIGVTPKGDLKVSLDNQSTTINYQEAQWLWK